ncbi:ankyrin repeat domain-containing protein 50 [Microdochium nivale]|nr:ankyrin repeat domain-containing protein 50 [Microdochium nivale]
MTSNTAETINLATSLVASGDAQVHIGSNTLIHNHSCAPQAHKANLRSDLLKGLFTCQYKERKNRNPERAPETCEWFVTHDRFRHWQQQTSALLWVSADPGCGKSVLTRHLVDNVLSHSAGIDSPVCYFFFKDDFEDQKTPEGALCCILHQLFVQRPELISEEILRRLDEEGPRFFLSFEALWDMLVDTAAQFHSTSRDGLGVICVLDALDECSNRSALVDALTRLYTTSQIVGLKILITSRPYHQIRIGFHALESTQPTIHLSGESQDEVDKISREITIVIQQRIAQIGQQCRLPEDMRRELAAKMSTFNNRTYLWVYLVFADMEKATHLSLDDFRRSIEKIPRTIEEAYDGILQRGRDGDQVRKVLDLVLAAERPLHLREMATALAFRGGSHRSFRDLEKAVLSTTQIKIAIREACGLFVIVVDDHIFLMHQTAKEFLLRSTSTSDHGKPLPRQAMQLKWQHSFDIEDSHSVLAEICVRYLVLLDSEKSDNTAKTWLKSNHDKLELLQYAAENWTIHYRHAQILVRNDLIHLAHLLCQTKHFACRVWLCIFGKKHPEAWAFVHEAAPALLIAGFHGLTSLLQPIFLAEPGSPEECTLRDGRTALSWASEKGHADFIDELLKHVRKHQAFWRKPLRSLAIVNKTDGGGRSPLWHAAANRHRHVVDTLLRHGAKVNMADEYGVTPLSWAVHHGDDDIVALLVEHGSRLLDFKVQQRGRTVKDGVTLLMKAASRGHESIVRLLLDQGADFEAKDSDGVTALMRAARNGHESVIRLLLDKGVDCEAKDSDGVTLLMKATSRGHESIVRLLLNHGADFEAKDNDGVTALMRAARDGKAVTAAVLLDHGSDIDIVDHRGRTAVFLAGTFGHSKTTKLLLDRGARVLTKDLADARSLADDNPILVQAAHKGAIGIVRAALERVNFAEESKSPGRTALWYAAREGHCDVVEVLLERGVRVEGPDATDDTALFAAARGGHKSVVEFLLQHGAPLSSGGRTAFAAAVSKEQCEIMEVLLDHSAQVTQADDRGEAIFSGLARVGCKKAAALLLDQGIDVEARDNYGRTALILAAGHGRVKLVGRLRDGGAQIEAHDNTRKTALMLAAMGGYHDIVEWLLDGGAQIEARDIAGRTSLMLAAMGGYYNIVERLLDGGAQMETVDVLGHTAASLAEVYHQSRVIRVFERLKRRE